MIDRRENPDFPGDKDLDLASVDDTTIMNNFAAALQSIAPQLAVIHALDQDAYAWDDISEALYYEMVYGTFAYKYGLALPKAHCHKHGFYKHCYRRLHHVECAVRTFPVTVLRNGEQARLSQQDVVSRLIVFKGFACFETDSAEERRYDWVDVDFADPQTGYRFKQLAKTEYYLRKEDLMFEFVAEDYDEWEHAAFREVFAD